MGSSSYSWWWQLVRSGVGKLSAGLRLREEVLGPGGQIATMFSFLRICEKDVGRRVGGLALSASHSHRDNLIKNRKQFTSKINRYLLSS